MSSPSGSDARPQLPPIVFPDDGLDEAKKLKKVDFGDAGRSSGENEHEEAPQAPVVTRSPRWMKVALVIALLAAAGLGVAVIALAAQNRELDSDVNRWRSIARSNGDNVEEAEQRASAAEGALADAEVRANDAERTLADLASTPISSADIVDAGLDGASLEATLIQLPDLCDFGGCDDPRWQNTELVLLLSCTDSSTCAADDRKDDWWSGELPLTKSGATWSGTTESARGTSCGGVSNPSRANNVMLELTVSVASLLEGGGTMAVGADMQLTFEVDGALTNCAGAFVVLGSQ